MANKSGHRGYGNIRRLPSKRYQASYVGPDTVRYAAPTTFDTMQDAEAWLVDERRLVSAGTWSAPRVRAAAQVQGTFEDYATRWLKRRDLKPRTRSLYAELIKTLLLPTFGERPLTTITPSYVADWYAELSPKTPTRRAHAYSLLRTILASAVADEAITSNPCRIRGAGYSKRVKKIEPATLDQLATIVSVMPDRLKQMVMLSSWCGLRFGEVTELRRKDVNLRDGVIHVRRAVAWADGEPIVGTPKSDAGIRDVAIPPHLLPALRTHLAEHTAWGREGLLFRATGGGHLATSSLNVHWRKAREAAGRTDLRWHDLRHTGAVLAASTGATLAELMARLGHSTPGAALRYQHAAKGRDKAIAAKLSELAGGS